MDVKQEVGIGPFDLGATLNSTIQYIKDYRKDVSSKSPVIIRFNVTDPMFMSLCLDITDLGVELRFNPVTQKLELIRVYNFQKQNFFYNGRQFSGKESIPSFPAIHDCFGPTLAGKYSEDTNKFELHYPGMIFVFDVPSSYDSQSLKSGKLPEHSSVTLNCLFIFVPEEDENSKSYHIKSMSKCDDSEIVTVNPSQGISIMNHLLRFGDSPQDVVTALGAPQHVTYKDETQLAIQGKHNSTPTYQWDYFYNYFERGIDILFDASTHSIKKFVLHTNFPSQRLFNIYQKCHYRIFPKSEKTSRSSIIFPSDHLDSSTDGIEKFEDGFDPITPETKVTIIS
eukprot:TRINITY_DN4940_c0_g1_i1.p1 TRINITY_DN4940_c0_g1~~TRINITY_DN4940_c0_g1_i1.p1  ORF type:complete len:339 (-),score=42.24 TRINITY_DN4940_c0_g1_i1:214-1230(-)